MIINYNHIFTNTHIGGEAVQGDKSVVAPSIIVSKPEHKGDAKLLNRQIVSLEYQMKAIQGKRKVVRNIGNTQFVKALSDTEEFVNNETNKFLKNKKWDKLGMWFQWSLISEYLASKNVPQDERKIAEEQFKLKHLEKVDYDNINKKVIRLNYCINNIEL